MLAHRIRGTDEKDIILKSKIQIHGRVPGIHSPIGGPGARRSLVLGVSKRGCVPTLANRNLTCVRVAALHGGGSTIHNS